MPPMPPLPPMHPLNPHAPPPHHHHHQILLRLDCGADFDCSTTTALTGGSQSATLTPYVACPETTKGSQDPPQSGEHDVEICNMTT